MRHCAGNLKISAIFTDTVIVLQMLSRLRLILILSLQAFTLNAQLYNFKNFSLDQGLPESRISAFCEDRRGNLWIGTLGGGLLRYDGYNFYTYSREDGLLNNFVHAIHEDTSGNLWIGTEDGICTYDGYKFTIFKGLEKQTVEAIMQDASGELWFGTATNGLYRYKDDVITKYVARDGVIDNTIQCFYRDKADNLWIGTGKGLVRYDAQGFRSFSTRNGLPSDNIRDIAEDASGNLWFATEDGISRLAGQTFNNYGIQNGLPGNNVYTLVIDGKGNLWTGTAGGIAKLRGNQFEHYNPSNTGQRATVITCMYSDHTGNLWFGSAEQGLSRLDCERFVHYPENDQMGKRIYAIIQALNGNMICGTSLGGTTVFDGHQYTLADGIEGFTSSIVQAFYYTTDSVLWVGTREDGVYKFDQTQVTRYTTSEGLASNNITGFAADGAGNLWLASGDSGVSVMQLHTSDSVATIHYINTANGLASNRINAIAFDGREALWIATEDKGLDRVAITTDSTQTYLITHFTIRDGLGSNAIHTVLSDTLGNIYAGTSQGISVFDGKRFTTISKANGLGSNNVYALATDNEGHLWAGTERGVDRLTFTNNTGVYTIRHFGSDEGFKGVEVYRNSICKDRNGNIWFGTVNGLMRYNPNEEVSDTLTPKVYISGIRLFFDNIEDTPYADSVSAWYAIPSKLTLPYNQNNLTFSFVGIHQRNPQAVRYKWILEGFSKDWSPLIADREATFSNLPPGEYTFRVMACNEYNVWNTTPAVFSFIIEPPMWERWWMRLLGVLAFTSLIWMIFYLRLRRIQARNRVIQEKLEMENNILVLEQEAARLQMNPHFIFNALNSIQGVISTNNAPQAKKYLSRFGRLMRLILENAREEFIPLENEISMLDNYLELEKLSANHGFDFTITHDEGINPAGIEIPPMMIQPFVENAVVHGLKKEAGEREREHSLPD